MEVMEVTRYGLENRENICSWTETCLAKFVAPMESFWTGQSKGKPS